MKNFWLTRRKKKEFIKKTTELENIIRAVITKKRIDDYRKKRTRP